MCDRLTKLFFKLLGYLWIIGLLGFFGYIIATTFGDCRLYISSL